MDILTSISYVHLRVAGKGLLAALGRILQDFSVSSYSSSDISGVVPFYSAPMPALIKGPRQCLWELHFAGAELD
ncbi:hypothetical protein PCANC_08195 [Puccinia coronata f. sp. avenae]|uniref:Uncharacterized protein n=1 Tax=Puccinia coronata f. sp. avenae TaxID=200324 RepID=A0A2N5VJG1_9BASI|nr:hypothetical protein PCANC_08195 [Puccinia coronata f. sp. avenae]